VINLSGKLLLKLLYSGNVQSILNRMALRFHNKTPANKEFAKHFQLKKG